MHIYLEILGMKSILVKLTIFYIEILILILRILLEKQIM